ncbi:MAG: hypothetical protein R3208_09460 [Ketobacteraceae bacterium]|nr:hypothetical protein [Ketobacteraceae bacterium]
MNLKKPPHVSKKVWEQHLDWMELMDDQVKANREERNSGPTPKSRGKKSGKGS